MASLANHRRHRSKQRQSWVAQSTVEGSPAEPLSLSKRAAEAVSRNSNNNDANSKLGAASTMAGAIKSHRLLRDNCMYDSALSSVPVVCLMLLLLPLVSQIVYDKSLILEVNSLPTSTASIAAAALGLKEHLEDGGQVAVSSSSSPTITITTTGDSGTTTTVPPHKHSSYVISQSDKLHKFDLFIDPVCEQIDKLTEKQLNKVHAQMKQFSQIVS